MCSSDLLGRGFQSPGGQLQILGVQGVFDVRDGDVAGRHGLGIEPDPHGVVLRPADAHLRHTRHRRNALDKVAVGVVGQLQAVQGGGRQTQEDDRLGVGVGLADRYIGSATRRERV